MPFKGDQGKARRRSSTRTTVAVGVSLVAAVLLLHVWYASVQFPSDASPAPGAGISKESYKDIFERRGKLYNAAMMRSPHARMAEVLPIINALKLQPGDTLIDAPAGGDYVAEAIFRYLPKATSSALQIFAVEPSSVFAGTGTMSGGHGEVAKFVSDSSLVRHVNAPLTDIPLPPGAANKLSSLAGLHHMSLTEKMSFFHESFRLLKEDGLFAVADVGSGTPPGGFLNDVADRLTVTGHKGMFFAEGELGEFMRRAGFVDIVEEYIELSWMFQTERELLQFVRDLFGLENAYKELNPESEVVLETIRKETQKYLAYQVLDVGTAEQRALLPWGLRFCTGRKPFS